jgi:predicted GH43/DUF377 family glycosyl hydrolase
MKNRKIANSDYIKRKINQSLQKKIILNVKTPNIISKKIFLESHNQNYDRKKESPFLTPIPSKIIRLDLPESGSFNAGILDLGNKILCVYRPNEYEFVACFLNYEYKVIDDFYYKFKMYGVTDPRIIRTPDNKVLMSYSIKFDNYNVESIAGTIIMDLNKSDHEIFEDKTIRISPKEITSRQKNWMPFVHEKKLYFIANIYPHEIYEVHTGSVIKSQKKYITSFKNKWFIQTGLRGNTNAVLLPNGNYLTTFHTVARDGNLHYYDNGFYIFQGKPPFTITHMSEKTYLKAEDATEPHYRKSGLILCAFPVGMILKDNKVIISYGDNDSCVKILESSLDNVMSMMVKVNDK